MNKNVFLSGYYYGYGDKIKDVEIASGVDQETDIELEQSKNKFASWILNELIMPLKTKKKLSSKDVYYFELWGDFTQTQMKKYQDFTIKPISNFKKLEKDFISQLRKEEKDE